MSLTTQQLQTLKTAINAETDPLLVEYRTTGNNGGMAGFYNEQASPTFTAWRSAVTRDEVSGDGFDWTQVDNLTVGQARIWDWLFDNQGRTMNAADAGKRAGVSECWKGTAAKVAVATFVLAACKRSTTRAEKVLATGVGSVASPAVMSFEGLLSSDDVRIALAS